MPHTNWKTARTRSHASQEGFILLAVIFLLFLFTLAMTVAAPKIARSIQRDRDKETMERGKQYIRAIQLYYRKFHAYPPSIDALVKTDNIRFLRKKYIDPITGKDDWQPIHFGQNKAPLAMGFFGQPLGGMGGATPIVGTGPSGGNAATGAAGSTSGSSLGSGLGSSPSGGLGSSLTGGLGSSPGGGSLFGSSTSSSSPTGSSLFGPSTSGPGAGATTSPTGASGSTSGTTGKTGASGTSGTSSSSSSTSGSSSGSSSGSATGLGSGPTFGGAGIVGFKPASPKQSILVYKGKDHYNQWEFTYSPLMDMKRGAGFSGATGQPASGANGTTGLGGTTGFGGTSGLGGSNSLGGSGNVFGGSGPGSSSGNSGSTGTSPSPSPTPTQPQ